MFQGLKTECRPFMVARSIATVDFRSLAAKGISRYLIDIDNTLAPRKSSEVVPEIVQALQKAREAGYIEGICLISNVGIPSARATERIRTIVEAVGAVACVCCYWPDLKPSPKPFRLALEQVGGGAGTTAMIGDQLPTDILGGNRAGLLTILVNPLGPDHWTSYFNRRKDSLLRRYYAAHSRSGNG